MTTVGVAIAVPEPHGAFLRTSRATFGDDQADHVPTHVTLIPPTDFTDACVDAIDEVLRDVAGRHRAYSMTLNGTGTFRPVSPVVFVAVAEGISQTELLAADVRDSLKVGEPQFPYHPHVTVAQSIADAGLDRAFRDLADFRCHFDVAAFTMYVQQGETWQTHRTYGLG